MLGNIVNAAAIIVGSLLGLLLHKGLKEKYKVIVVQAIGMSVIFIGGVGAIVGLMDPDSHPILFIISLVIGGLIGELLKIEDRLEDIGLFLQRKVGRGEHNIAKGFVSASLIFCVGTMAIMGSLESGLNNNHNMLLAKSVLDGVTSVILASTLGVGVIFSAVAVFIYQGLIVIFAGAIEPLLTVDVLREISIIGGILIFAIGINIMEIKKIKTGNMLPAIIIPVIYYFVIIPIYSSLF